MGATSSGSGRTNSKARDQARAAFMQKHPNQFPDSISKGGWRGEGAGLRDLARAAPKKDYMDTGKGQFGYLGGILAQRMGFNGTIPKHVDLAQAAGID